jgi:hypothetical protein
MGNVSSEFRPSETQKMKRQTNNYVRGIAGILLALATIGGCAPEPKCFEVDDVFLAHAPTFEPGRFGQAVRDPLAGHGGLFLWYPSVLPEEGTFSGWVKPEAGLGWGPLFPHIQTDTALGGKPDYGLEVNPDWLGLAIQGQRPDKLTTDAQERFGVGRHLKIRQWNHIAATFGPQETKVYVNGELAATGPGIALRGNPGRDYLSLVTDLMQIHAPGLLDEFILFNRVLPAQEVQALYRRTEPYPEGQDTVAIWRFDGDTRMRLPKQARATGGSLFYRTGSAYSLFRDERGVAIKMNVINWNAQPVEWTVRLKVDDMHRNRVYDKTLPVSLAARSQKQWSQKFEGLANGMFYGTFELAAKDGTVLDRRGSIFGKTLAPDRMKITQDARFQVGAEAATYCNWPDNGMTFTLMRQSNWADVEPEQGKWSWAILDAFVKQARAENIHFVFGSASCPLWAVKEGATWASGNWEMVPQNPQGFSTYVEALARRYKGQVETFEVCNEPGYLTPTEYADFVARAKRAIQTAGADIKVIAGFHSSQQWLDQMVVKTKGSMDILSTHPYCCLTLENEKDVYPTYLKMLPHVRSLGMTGPWWATEVGNWGGHLRADGYPMTREDERRFRGETPARREQSLEYFNSQEDLANMAVRSMLVSFASGVERYSWHYYRALSSCDCIADYHLLAFGNVVGLLTGGEFVRQLDLGGDDLWAFQFRNKGRTIIAYWQAAKAPAPRKAHFKVNTATYALTDIYGNSKEYKSQEGLAEVEVTSVPQFLRTSDTDITVIEPVLALRGDAVIMPGQESKITATIRDPLSKTITGKLTLHAPAGVTLAPADFTFEAGPGEERSLQSTLLVPPGLGLMDRQIRAEIQTDRLGSLERTLAMNVRQSTTCAKLNKEIRIDGDLGKWADVPAIHLDRKSQVIAGSVRPEGDPNPTMLYEWDGPQDLSGIVRTAWDPTNLYMSVKVRKKGRILNTPRQQRSTALYEGDCVELFLDFEPREGKGYGPNTWQIFLVPPTEDHPTATCNVFQPAARQLAGIELVGKVVEGGYVIEAKIPWSNFAPFAHEAGKVIGFDVAIDDQDSPVEQVYSDGKGFRKCQIGWGENKNFSGDRSQFGRMVLGK